MESRSTRERSGIRSRLSYANVMATVAVFLALSGGAYALTVPRNSVGSPQVKNHSLKVKDVSAATKRAFTRPRGFARIRVVGVIEGTSFWDMALVGPSRGFLSARTPGGGITCLKPDPRFLTLADVKGGVMTDASGNDTRQYFNGSFGCDADEVRVMQKSNGSGALTNQNFNIVVP